MKRFICMVFVVLMAVFAAVPAYAADMTKNNAAQGVITPRFTYISMLD